MRCKVNLGRKGILLSLACRMLLAQNEMPKAKNITESKRNPPRIWRTAGIDYGIKIHYEFPVSLTDEAAKITEQTKKHILPFDFAMMGSFNGKRRDFCASN